MVYNLQENKIEAPNQKKQCECMQQFQYIDQTITTHFDARMSNRKKKSPFFLILT